MILRALTFCIALLSATFAAAQEDMGRNSGIETTITSQLEAFKRDDFDQAFTFASPSIQGMFGTADRFGAMVRNGYPMVWRPRDVTYLELRQIAGGLWQKVQIIDQRGNAHYLDYRMIKGPDGWRISGVQLLKAPDVSV
ncbi:MAG: DUF4864 domain-containing protein [Marinovum sp.]|nr:DUF4864 domain-containing protein [Marinovum sp.]